MSEIEFSRLILKNFPYKPTNNQERLINKLSEFLFIKKDKAIFVLKGYAGTGKTTVVSSIVKNLNYTGKKSVLLAPTGRAAKVLSTYSGKKAFTIHKKIYLLATKNDGSVRLTLARNIHKNTIFLVDEASMIPDNSVSPDMSLFSRRNLLEDLINYVYEGENCKLILIGDTAQLPPVGLEVSPALNMEYLKRFFDLSINTYELKEVVRQALESGILANATNIRNRIVRMNRGYIINLENFTDIKRITGEELEDALNEAYSETMHEETVVITRSNKRANIFNQEIRKRILFLENEITAGDYLMVVKNNYFWLDKDSKAGFIANGDIIEILRIGKFYDLYGFRFADVTIRMTDYPDEKDLNVKILLDTLMIEGPSLTSKENQRLFDEVKKDYEDIPSRRKRIEEVKNNPFFNALQVKFAYALTCHKTQGGQWKNVFIDQGYLTEERINREYFRWLYTAFTRATDKLYLVNFHDRFFK
ncbi:MAG: AAA family ATPase [Bacteroidetes bacterium]|nr:AAA family ATPase [Bacteroidota bacterium]MBL7105179.1 AAA family ATPase [Bacteroidales bacterium]